MFTGLIERTGTVARVEDRGADRLVEIEASLSAELAPGESIAVNGVCLTVASCEGDSFFVHVSPETLRVTTLREFVPGRVVNLERALRADARLGGHFVLGHADGVGTIERIEPEGESYRLDVDLPPAVERFIIPKGSIAVDGISLTIADIRGDVVRIQIVPFTWQHTALSSARAGDRVNVEADVIGKYVVRLLEGQLPAIAVEQIAGRS
jgi:riboflavin synthase